MTPGGEGGKGDQGVQIRGRGDVDDIDLGVGHEDAPIAGRFCHAELLCLGARRRRIAGGDGGHFAESRSPNGV